VLDGWWWKADNKADSIVDMNTAESRTSRMRLVVLLLLGVIVFVAIGIVLEDEAGFPFETTYRIGCAVACLTLLFRLGQEHPGERWLRVGFWFAFIVNVGLFFTPIVDRPASRGELMIFALPDAVVLLAVGLAYYPDDDVRQRAVRQQMILGLVVAVLFCATLFGFALLEPHTVG
jgi:FtsH-binding integral membrane protein